MDITLIPAIEADRAFFRRVHHEAYRESIESMFEWDEAQQDAFVDRDFDTRNPQIVYYDGEPCGVMGCQYFADEIVLGPVFVLPAFQGKGIGTHVVNLFIQKAEKSIIPLRLKTLKVNIRAKELYERLGFHVSKSTEQYWFMEYLPVALQ